MRAPLEGGFVEESRVSFRGVDDAHRGDGVLGIVADHAVEELGQIGDGAGHRSHLRGGYRVAVPHAGATDQAGRRAHAGRGGPGGGALERGAGFFAERDGGEVCGEGAAGTARRSADGAVERVGIAGVAEEGAVGVAAGVFAERGFAEDDGAFLAELGDDEGIEGRAVVGESGDALGGGHTGGVDFIFYEDDDTVHGAGELAGLGKSRVEFVGFGEGGGVEGDDAVDRRALLVVGLDPVQVELHELARGEFAGEDGGLDIGDGGLDDVERFGGSSGEKQR